MHLAVLWVFAIAQPLFEILNSGELFAYAGWKPMEIVTFSLAVVLLPPALLVLVVGLGARINARLGSTLHLFFVAGLVAVFLGYLIKRVDPTLLTSAKSAALLGAVCFAVGAALALVYARVEPARSFMTVLAPAPIVFLIVFLFASPTTELVFPDDPEVRGVDAARQPPVVLVVLDELPTVSLMTAAGRLDRRRYPGFGALAADATWFRNATSVHDYTIGAVPAILTGRRSGRGDPASASVFPENLFTLLGGTYRLNAHEFLTRLCPAKLCPDTAPEPFPQRVTKVLPTLAKLSADTFLPTGVIVKLPEVHPFPATVADEEFRRFTASIAADEGRSLSFFHSELPHQPWTHFPSGKKFPPQPLDDLIVDFRPGVDFIPGPLSAGPGAAGHDRWTANQSLVTHARQLHLAQLQHTDLLLKELIDRLRATGVYDRSLIVVTADHGISFKPKVRSRVLSRANAPEVMGVPLFVKRPSQREGRTDESYVQTIDIVPTIADVLGARIPWRVDGRSVFNPRRRNAVLRASSTRSSSRVRIPASTFKAERDAAARKYDALFGSKTDGSPVFRLGPHQELLGRRTSELDVARSERGGVSLDDPQAVEDVDLASKELPALVRGRLNGAGADTPAIAIEMNGRIVATRRTYRSSGETRFTALLPESSFRSRNRLSIYRIASAGGSTRLVPLG